MLCDENQIEMNNVMICNYVKHLNIPNFIEENAEIMIPETIQNTLNSLSPDKYSYCFYQWFGYRFYMYNFIYRYKRHLVYEIFNYATILEKLFENNGSYNNRNTITSKGFSEFLENIYDITDVNKQSNITLEQLI
jgi:hypothetical protein